MSNPAPKRTRNIALAVLLLASAGRGYESTGALSATTRDEVWSFDMWCLEMRLYPSQRCDARRTEDVKDYEFYRAEVEKFDKARNTQAERNKELQQKLNPDSTPAKSSGPVR
jgi:phosphoglucomutase